MTVKRLEEEEALLNMEMKNYMVFYLEKMLPILRERKEKIKDSIGIVVSICVTYTK